ncbi:MAG: hypothetical protein QGI09_12375, partial [Dehalococcoidia bacterium]|nr:hypothetical protein [Dehalococcoidia bacterium]
LRPVDSRLVVQKIQSLQCRYDILRLLRHPLILPRDFPVVIPESGPFPTNWEPGPVTVRQ